MRYDEILTGLDQRQAGLRQDAEFRRNGGRFALEQCARRREYLLSQLAENAARERRILSRLYRLSGVDIEQEQRIVGIAIQLVKIAKSKGLPIVSDPITMVRNAIRSKGKEDESTD